jgi:hypothetical protein
MRTSFVLFSFFLAVLFLFGCSAQAQDEQADFDYGKIEEGSYSNTYFNFSMDVPEDWHVQTSEEAKLLMEMGQELLAGDDENMKAILNASEINVANLIGFYKFELGTTLDFNPNLFCIAENLQLATGIKNGGQYLDQVKGFLEKGELKYDFLSEDYEKKAIGDFTFYVMDAKLSVMGSEVSQRYYSTIVNGFALNFFLSYHSEESLAFMQKIMKSIEPLD